MSAIFISHSSRDNAAAEAMQRWLRTKGHQSIFLDFDPADGIPAGHNWEQELYHRLRACRAVIALLSRDWLASRWCFAEVTQARALGKAIFPVRIADCGDDAGVLPDVQHIDLIADQAEGYRRLEGGLQRMGLDPREMFDWDASRPPYPGLLAFQEQDAAIYFGRDADIDRARDTLNRLRQLGGARLVLFLGASGSGKSSLVRAGLLPRLRRDRDNWLPVPPFRPQERPLDELALALADGIAGTGMARNWQDLREELRRAGDAAPPDGAALVDLARDLQIAADRREATVLLTVDQTEELFGYDRGDETDRFLRLLRSGLEAGGGRLMALATMRSDFLGEFQTHRALLDLDYETVTVDPMSVRSLPEIIEKPGEVAGIELGPGLVPAMLQDMATTDALPLLAFTLRELYERYGDDGVLELSEYRELGGLEGSVRRAADGVIQMSKPSEVELEALHGAFVPAMVRISEEGQYARRRAVRADLPQPAQALLQRFVEARLLVSDRDQAGQETLEVAHEALLRAWPRLRGWLDEDQDKLRLRDTIRLAAYSWHERGREQDWLDHRGNRLAAAEALVDEPRFALKDGIERDYLQACLDRRRREEQQAEEQRQREAKAERDRLRRTRIFAAVTSFLLVVVAGFGYFAWNQWGIAATALTETSRRLALTAQQQINSGDSAEAVNTALEAFATADTEQARSALEAAVLRLHQMVSLSGHESAILWAEFSPDGQRVATASADGVARLWDATAAEGITLAALHDHDGAIYSVRFSPDGRYLVTASADGTARIWDAATGKPLAELSGHDRDVYTAEFSPDGRHVVTASDDGTARVWDAATGATVAVLKGHEKWLNMAQFSPDGERVVTAAADNTARIWNAATGEALPVLRGHTETVNSARFSPDGSRVVTASDDGTARIWDAATGDILAVLEGHESYVLGARFSPDGSQVVTASDDGTARIWDAATGQSLVGPLAHDGKVNWAEFGPDGKLVVTASDDWTAHLWDAASGASLAVLDKHFAPVRSARFSADGQRVVTASDDARARLWWVRNFETFEDLLAFAKALDLSPSPTTPNISSSS